MSVPRVVLVAALVFALASQLGCAVEGTREPGCKPGSGVICTIAGNGIAGPGDDLRPALGANFYLPLDVTIDPEGRPVIVDWNNYLIRRIDADGLLRTIAGPHAPISAPTLEPSEGYLWNHPTDVTFDGDGEMVVALWHSARIVWIDLASKTITRSCGSGKPGSGGDGGPADHAELSLPVGVAFDHESNLYISDQGNKRIRRVDGQGVIMTWAGAGGCQSPPCSLGDGGPKEAASFNFPNGQVSKPGGKIAFDASGNFFVADTSNHRVRRIGTDGIITTIAGSGTQGSGGDGGPATSAQLTRPTDVAVGPDGLVYIADAGNNCIRRVRGDGTIETVAGVCCAGSTCDTTFAGDGGPATAARLNQPMGITLDTAGNLYVADTQNQRVRIVYR